MNGPLHNGLTAAVITAAGKSTRMGGAKKELAVIDGTPVLKRAVSAFVGNGAFHTIVITFPPDGESSLRSVCDDVSIDIIWVPGGQTRQESVFNALSALTGLSPEYVLIHDAARPWVSQELITSVLQGTREYGACIPVVPHVDAPKRIDSDGIILNHLERTTEVGAQTPQGFRFTEILEAHRKARAAGREYPDDAEAYHHAIGNVHTVTGDPANRKITFRHDI